MIAFGPVPSRRLGRSLGINNIPPVSCTYSCVYCQVGPTVRTEVDRRVFFPPEQVAAEVEQKVKAARAHGERVDYLTFVPDGEPTLDVNLGREIGLLRSLKMPIAVITNASLLWRSDVREDLCKADWVSLKVDTVKEEVWRRVNRPHRFLEFSACLGGMISFARQYRGILTTETLLVEGLNDSEEDIDILAEFVGAILPATAYLGVPTRPPAEPSVRPPTESVVNRAFQIVSGSVRDVELLTGYEGDAFACTGDAAEDLLSIAAVHPLREEAVWELLIRGNATWEVVQHLVAQGLLSETEYEGRKYYLRRCSTQCDRGKST